MVFGTFFRQERIVVQQDKPLISSVRFQHDFWPGMGTGILVQLEIVFFPIGKRQRNNLPTLEIHQNLSFQRVPLFLSRIVSFLLFLGRSIGDSVASTRITSYSISLFNGAFRPGREKVPSWISVSSTHLMPR